jgi:C1A family cysteine protease
MKNLFIYILLSSSLLLTVISFGSEELLSDDPNQKSINMEQSNPVEWYNLDGIPPVGDQVVAGSCFAWAAAYYYLTHLQWQEYGWDVNDPAHQFSPAFVYNLTNGGYDNRAWEGDNARRDAFEVLRTLGCATMEDMPYNYTAYSTFPTETAFRNGMKFRTLSTHEVNTRNDSGLQIIKDHLLAGNLAVLGIFGYRNLDNISNYNNIYCHSQTTGGRLYWHEVTIIGYNDTLVTADGVGAFRLVNSWSAGWGDAGYFWMSYEAVKHTKTSYGYAMYATDRIGYEPTLTTRIEVGHSDRYNLVYKTGLGDPGSPDMLLTFFDYSPMSLATGISYPDESALVLDLTDMISLMQTNESNNIFLRIDDNAPSNGYMGYIKSLMIEDLSEQLCTQTMNIPILIEDANVGAEEEVAFDYSTSPPVNISAEPATEEGLVQLSWDEPLQQINLLGYNIYLNGRLIDNTSSNTYNHFLSIRGTNYYDVTAVFDNGESLGAMVSTLWDGTVSFGIPFEDNFESGFSEWVHVGSSGISSFITEDPVYEGQYSAGLKSTAYDNTALLRPFETIAGADIETWFKLDVYPVGDMGAGGCVFLIEDGLILGTFFDPYGHPGYAYTLTPGNPIPVHLDSSVTINQQEWYKQKLRYYNGKLQIMLIDSNWDVLFNTALNTPVQGVNQAALFVQGINGGWNHFDKFSIIPWAEGSLLHFNPVSATDDPYAFIISEASINTNILQAGDEIAIYDGDLCVGAVTVDGKWPLELNAWEADSVNSGFISGNTILARLWSSQSNLEYETNITFDVGDGNFDNGIFSRVAIEGTNIVSVQDNVNEVPRVFALSQNYPNPFNPSTIIRYSVPHTSRVSIRVFDILGNEVSTLVDDNVPAGDYTVEFSSNGGGTNLASGIYFYKLQAGNFIETKKMILMK